MKKYDAKFFDYVDSGAIRSAERFITTLMPELHINTMLDVGCGRGGWAGRWKFGGCEEVMGIDGDYVDQETLYIDKSAFKIVDLNGPFDLQRRFDLVQSLEVAEHLRPTISKTFVDSLVRHGDVILFSAGTPGQGGTGHINERPLEYWRNLFASHSYEAFDFVRLRLHKDRSVEPWYRFNTILYASESGQARLSAAVKETKIDTGEKLPDYDLPSWRARKAVLRHFPVSFIDRLAVLNAKLRTFSASRRSR